MEDLKTSIKYIGVCRPIIVNRRNKTIIAGHQRVKAMIELGIKRGPVFYIEFINNENEVRINQIHNAIEDTGEGINVSVGISEKLGFVMTREINAVPQNTVKVMNYVYIIGRYGNIDSAVALQDGTVIKGADYLLACKMTHIPARVFYIENDKKDRARCLLFKDYGQFCYDGKRNDSYQQNLAQMNRLVGARRANYSQTYAMALRGGLLKDKRTLDFGAGKCAFAEKLANKGYDITPIEFFRISPGGGIAADWANAQIDLIACTIKNKGLYDVVICDSVLNSVISEEAETDVINCCAVFLKENGRLFISGRLLTNYKRDGWHKTIYQLDDKWFTMNMRHGEWYAQHFHKKETVKPLLEKHGLVVLEIEFDTNAWRAVCGKGKINLENCLRSIDNEFNIKYNKTQSYKKGDIMREALLRAYS
jgi:ParB family chromosome partitioning protein